MIWSNMDNIIWSIFIVYRNYLLSMTVTTICGLIWIPQTIHFRYFTFVNYERHKRKRNDVIGRIIITTMMAAVIVTAFYVLTHLQVMSPFRFSRSFKYTIESLNFHFDKIRKYFDIQEEFQIQALH